MEALLQYGRYKVIEKLFNEEEYSVCICEDIEKDDLYHSFIANIYEGNNVRRFLPIYYNVVDLDEGAPYFIGLETGANKVIAKFEFHEGMKLLEYIKSVNKDDFEEKIKLFDELIEELLKSNLYPPEIGICSSDIDNFVVMDNKVKLNFVVKPICIKTKKYKLEQYINILDSLFVKNNYLPDKLDEYLNDFRIGKFDSLVSAYSIWKEIKEDALNEYFILRDETFLMKGKRLFVKWIKSKWRKFRRKK